jgi:thiamine biosynthesis lipoprotein
MYHSIQFRSMNTDVNAWLWHPNATVARRALQEVERAFQQAHARFTRFEAGSELCALNASGGLPFAASDDLFDVATQALRFCELTHGLFNPAIISALESAGYDRTFDEVKRGDARRMNAIPAPVACPSIQLNAERRTITLRGGARLDLGGIAKGWTAQRAAQRLSQHGACLVDAGGDMFALGTPPGQTGWPIGVMDLFDPESDLATLRIRDEAVATSGVDHRRWTQGGVLRHHLIDPRTGLPSESNLLRVTVIAPTLIEAEIYAKVIFLLGLSEGMGFVEARPELAALCVTRDGEAIVSSHLEKYIDVQFIYDHSQVLAA